MAKNTIRTYSTTAASNTDVGGVDIQGTAPASNMDDSVREIMSHLAETNAGTAPVDDTWSFCDPADATKKFRFDGGNITAGQTRVLSIPDADMVLGNIPNANDGAALGSASKSWSDLFLASGGVINFANSNYTVTHASGSLTFSGLITVTDSATITATNDGATGAQFWTQHISASPAASDIIANWIVQAKDSAGNTDTYAHLRHIITDPTSGSEDGYWSFLTRLAGTLDERLRVGAGLMVGSPTGGDQGAGTINASAAYADGVRIGGAPDAVLEDQKSAGTAGGTFTSGAWRTRDLNTEVRDAYGVVSISSNQFTPTVNGWVEWSAPALKVKWHQTRLFNVTDTAVVGSGMSAWSDNNDNSVTTSSGGAPVVAGKTYRIEHQANTTQSTNGFGDPANMGITEVYTRVKFWRT